MNNQALETSFSTRRALRVGSVSYFNAKPLIYGLHEAEDIALSLEVPSRLLEGLQARRYDVALLPVIDYQRMVGLRIIPSGAIGCFGPTLTVRIFSDRPIHQIRSLACDTDSHTSVALARIILAEKYGLNPTFTDLKRISRQSTTADPARLLIGDKVVCEEPAGLEHQLDLGAAWKEMTGLPFVFAVWMARDGVELGDLPARLADARRQGLEHVCELVRDHALPRGWPAGIALRYLTEYLKFDITPTHLEAIRLFHQLAARHGIIGDPPRELVVEQ